MDTYLLKPNSTFQFKDWNPSDKQRFPENKEAGIAKLAEIKSQIYTHQVALFAEKKHRLLVILQGMDTSGKDGTIRHVFGGLDPQGIHVATFGKPSSLELSHDYLWRIHKETPQVGLITIFNRSHYEDVLAVRVRKLQPQGVWSKRFKHITDFEEMLTDEATTIIKCFLNIDKEEQKTRLMRRIENPNKHWKLHPEDINDRTLWPHYQEAYEEAITKTNTPFAPWHIIPSNRKWYRNLVVAELILPTLQKLNPQFPEPEFDPKALKLV